jgi:hypothetical protein
VNSGIVLVTFTTNGSTRKPGWLVSYTTKSYNWCSGNAITFTDPSGTVADGSGHFNYRNSTVCRWEIIPATGGPVQLSFNSFNTEPVVDYIRIYDLETQQLLAQYSGDYTNSNLPGNVIAPSGKMFIIFVANNNTTDEGWSANWSTLPAGIPDLSGQPDVEVFPNPTSDHLTIRLSTPSKKDFNLELMSTDGKGQLSTVLLFDKGMTEKNMDVSGLASGVYFIRIISNDGVVIKKVVIN